MKMNGIELKGENIKVTNNNVKAKYSIKKGLLSSMLKKKLSDRGRIDEISGMPIMATECYWDDLSGKVLDPVLVKKARKEEM